MIRELKDKIKIDYMCLIFNLINIDTVDLNTNIALLASKEPDIQGGYGDITHFTTKDGHDIFVVPQEDGSTITYSTFTDGNENQAYYERNSNGSMDITRSTRVIIANSDGYAFDSYGLEGKVDFSYMQNQNGNTVVSEFVIKEPTTFEELKQSGVIPKDVDAIAFAHLNGLYNVFQVNNLQSGTTYNVPDPKNTFLKDKNGEYKTVLNIDLVNNTSYNNIFYVIKNLKIA